MPIGDLVKKRYKVKLLDAGAESVFLESLKILWLLTAGHKKNHKKCSYNFIFIFWRCNLNRNSRLLPTEFFLNAEVSQNDGEVVAISHFFIKVSRQLHDSRVFPSRVTWYYSFTFALFCVFSLQFQFFKSSRRYLIYVSRSKEKNASSFGFRLKGK